MPKCYRQLQVKDLPKVPRWWLEWYSNLQPSVHKAPNLPLSHHTLQYYTMISKLRNTCTTKPAINIKYLGSSQISTSVQLSGTNCLVSFVICLQVTPFRN